MTIYTGEDKAISIVVSDALGVPQSIDDMTDLVCYLFDVRSKVVLEKYKKVAASGYSTLVRVSSTEYTAILPHTISEDLPITDLMIEIEVQESDARFPDGIRRTKGTNKVTEIKSSIIPE